MGPLYVASFNLDGLSLMYGVRRAAFYGIIDALAILPYYIEIMLQQDTVRFSTSFL